MSSAGNQLYYTEPISDWMHTCKDNHLPLKSMVHYQLDLKYSRMITPTVTVREPHSEDEKRLKLRSSGMDEYPTSALPLPLETAILLCTLTHSSGANLSQWSVEHCPVLLSTVGVHWIDSPCA